MVINQSFFYQVRKAMLNPYTMTYQPYYFIQAPNTTYPQFLYHDQASLLFSSFVHHNPTQNGISILAQPSEPSKLGNGSILAVNTPKTIAASTFPQNISQKGYIIKEKIIKKPANRPATYLTEKKYYLSQTLDEESNSNRRLRPRKLKKRSRDVCKGFAIAIQTQLPPKDKFRDYATKGDIGSSQYAEESCKKKDEQRSSRSNERSNILMDTPSDNEGK